MVYGVHIIYIIYYLMYVIYYNFVEVKNMCTTCIPHMSHSVMHTREKDLLFRELVELFDVVVNLPFLVKFRTY